MGLKWRWMGNGEGSRREKKRIKQGDVEEEKVVACWVEGLGRTRALDWDSEGGWQQRRRGAPGTFRYSRAL